MPTLITDRELEQRIQDQRRDSGANRYDEMWEGTYVMTPMPNDEHQEIVSRFTAVFQDALGWTGAAQVRPGVNVSDRVDQWDQNYRVPDVAVFLAGGAAVNCDSFWHGGPDFVVEVVSRDDKSRDKLPFYGRVGVREVLLVDRHPWQLELYSLQGERLALTGRSTSQDGELLHSQVIAFTFCLRDDPARPHIEAKNTTDARTWLI